MWHKYRSRAALATPLPITKLVLWRLTDSASGKRAEVRVWVMDNGRQLRATIDGELTWSHQFGWHYHHSELTAISDDCRASLGLD